ncbi:MAG: metallophosphoesterase [Planctomycetaceae bacterium]|nr:metallophosphoesterase [Planctomycetaceae bacterium]
MQLFKGVGCPAIFVPGNNETDVELREACAGLKEAHVLHGSGVEMEGIPFFGVGGGIPVTPFGSWSFDFTEEQGAELLRDCPRGAVLVSHSPPKGVVDVTSSGKSIGSSAVREAILRLTPRLVVCGHVHHSAGESARLGNSPVINVGPAGMVVEL